MPRSPNVKNVLRLLSSTLKKKLKFEDPEDDQLITIGGSACTSHSYISDYI